MEANEYQRLAMTTLNPELNKRDVLINSVMGLCGEAGEAIDIVKKWMAHGHELDREHLAKELGTSPGTWRRRQRLWTCPWRIFCRQIWKSSAGAIPRALTQAAPKPAFREICKYLIETVEATFRCPRATHSSPLRPQDEANPIILGSGASECTRPILFR